MNRGSTARGVFVLAVAMMMIAAGSAFFTVVDFETLTPGDAAEGPGAVHALLDITDWDDDSTAVVVEEDGTIRSYSASTGINGCLDGDNGLGWDVDEPGWSANPPERNYWRFALDDSVRARSFSILMLDYGDFWGTVPGSVLTGPESRTATITAYNSSGGHIAHTSFTAPVASTDACAANGAVTLAVSSSKWDIAYVDVSFDGIDVGIGFDDIAFEWVEAPTFSCDEGDIFVSAVNNPTPIETAPLEVGHQYDLTAYGTYYAGGNTIRADAKYSKNASQSTWEDSVAGYESYGPELLDLLVGFGDAGTTPTAFDWGPLDDVNHTYTKTVLGDGNPAELSLFQIYDFAASNNTGGLCVSLDKLNRAPVAADDAYLVNQDTVLNVSAPGVLGNDTDADGDAITAVWVSDPDDGSVTLNADGSFIYTPDLGFYGSDSFEYKAYDGIDDSNTATVTITVDQKPSGLIVLPVEGSVHTLGDDLILAAEYYDDNPGSAVYWAVRVDENVSCSNIGGNQYWGNVDGDHDPFTWAAIPTGMRFDSTVPATETATWPAGDYCFAFNPGYGDNTPSGEYDVRLISRFTMNTRPVADANGPYSGDEGSAMSLDGTGSSDSDGDPLSYSWTVDSGLCTFDDASNATPDLTCTDNGFFSVTLAVNDGQATDSDTTSVMVSNVAPTVGPIAASPTLIMVGESVNASSGFTDPGTADTHTAVWDWGDGTTNDPGSLTQGAGFGSVDDTHTYGVAGVYNVTLTVTDDDGGSGTAVFEFPVIVYDPSEGFVTGGGWFYSEPGSYVPDDSLEGKATFGFVSKYKKGAKVPTGNTEFQFHAGELNFHSSTYDWLVVTGSDYARYKGVGTINGAGEYKFMIWAGDKNPDTFRIKIWIEDEFDVETVIYDNGTDQVIGAGSIVIHTKKK